MSEVFYPNNIRTVDIDKLEDWQLLVAACHFGPHMGDCQIGDGYGYTFDGEMIYCEGIPLRNDISMSDPIESLEKYSHSGGWRAIASDALHKGLREYWATEGDPDSESAS